MSNEAMGDRVSHIGKASYDEFDPNILSEDRVTEEDILDVCRFVIERYGRTPA